MMKVDTTTSHESAATQQIDAHRTPDRAARQREAGPGTDRVTLSSDAALMTKALHLLESKPAVRQELIQQMQTELAHGRIGADVDTLADSIIDRLLEQ